MSLLNGQGEDNMLDIVYISSNTCGICSLYKGTWRRLKDARPAHSYREYMIYSKADTALALNLYGTDQVPHIVIMKDGKKIDEIVGANRLKTLLEKVDSLS